MNKQTVRDIDLAGKKVLLRVDYNVPLDGGRVRDDFRVKASLPTLEYLLEQKCSIVLVSHLGRPEGKADPRFSLKPVAEILSSLLGKPVEFVPDTVGDQAKSAANSLLPGGVILLENLRFDPREEAGDPEFAAALATLADIYVDDAFAAIHRSHASITGVAKLLPAVSGLLVEKEVTGITEALENPRRPLVGMIGGAKVSDKIEVIDNLLERVDTLIIGGAMANTFIAAQGHDVGKSVYEPDQAETAKRIMQSDKIVLPIEMIAAASIDPPTGVHEIHSIDQLKSDELITDVGKHSVNLLCQKIMSAGTVIWNGPFGLTEFKEFATGSLELAKCLAQSKAVSIIGGGDTAEFIDAAGLHDKFDLVSTGGGAALELMAGKTLPGIEALLDKQA